MQHKIPHRFVSLILALAISIAGFTPALAAPPNNDNFADAEIITSLPFSATVDITEASIEPGEVQSCDYFYQTIWFSFTPAQTIFVRANTQGSSIYWTNVNVYSSSGPGMNNLNALGCGYYGNSFDFLAEAGQTYYLQVSPIINSSGNIQINLEQVIPPANDNFADAEVISSLPFSTTVNVTDAGIEAGEPQGDCEYSPKTVWYSFTPTANIAASVNLAGSSISDTILKIYQATGSGIGGLSWLLCATSGDSANFSFQAGETYYFQAGNMSSAGGNLQLNLQEIFPPVNDNFANATVVDTLPFSSAVNNTYASLEPSESQIGVNCSSSRGTVWYSYTPTANGTVKVDMAGSSIADISLNIYQDTGSGINGLSFLACIQYPSTAVAFSVQAGATYYIQAGSVSYSGGDLHLNMQEVFPPANDNFVNATVIDTLPFSDIVNNTDTTTEPNEPVSCYYSPKTVWYSFTSTVKTLVSANTQGSTISNNLNVYHDTGSGISGLNLVPNGCTYNYGTVTFIAEAGQTYYFQVGGIYGEVGTIQVNLEQLPLPANDDFANAAIASLPLPFDDNVDTQYSTLQTGEPTASCAGYGPGSRSVWYAFTPATSGSFSASIFGYAFTPVFAAYTGNSMGNLTQVGCQTYTGNQLTFHANAGTTYYFQVGNLYPWEQGGSVQFHLDVTPPPQASFYTNPWDPSKYDTVQSQDNSYDPGQIGFQTYTWDFGEGTTATGYSAPHKYAADGDYQVSHIVTTTDGRTATITQTVQIRTHDVAITKIATPASANVGQTKTITVTLRNIAYPETVQIDLYKSTPAGFIWVATVTKAVPALSGNRTTAVNFSYTFTSDDAKLGKVTFKGVATLINVHDAYPSDNEAISSITKISK